MFHIREEKNFFEMDRSKRPQDVNEALSSMLWTPYNRSPSISSSDDSDIGGRAASARSISNIHFIEPQSTQYCNSILVPCNKNNNVSTYFMKQYNGQRMVKSFTDNFMPYPVDSNESSYHETIQASETNRFSNDFTYFDISTCSSNQSSNNSCCSASNSLEHSINYLSKLNQNHNEIVENQLNFNLIKTNNQHCHDDDDDDVELNDNDKEQDYDEEKRLEIEISKHKSNIAKHQSPSNNNNSTRIYVQSHHSDYSPTTIATTTTTSIQLQSTSNQLNDFSENNFSFNEIDFNNQSRRTTTTTDSSNLNYYRTVPVKIINNNNNNRNNIINNNSDNEICEMNESEINSDNCNNRIEVQNVCMQKKINFSQNDRNYQHSDYEVIHNPWIPTYHSLSVANHPFVISPMVSSILPNGSAPVHRPGSDLSRKGCCGRWFAGPPLRALIAVVALGGLACAIGGAAVGITGLSGPPTSHLTAALLMIGVGVILVTVSGAAWHMTSPHITACFGGFSFNTQNELTLNNFHRQQNDSTLYHYSEFQHRSPPPSYHASMQEYRLRLLLLERDRMNSNRDATPPPSYNPTTTITNENSTYFKNDLYPS